MLVAGVVELLSQWLTIGSFSMTRGLFSLMKSVGARRSVMRIGKSEEKGHTFVAVVAMSDGAFVFHHIDVVVSDLAVRFGGRVPLHEQFVVFVRFGVETSWLRWS